MAAPLDVIALVSGGKDSFLSLYHCLAHGHRVVALANLHPPAVAALPVPCLGGAPAGPEPAGVTAAAAAAVAAAEAAHDSHMYQTAGHALVARYAACLVVPVYRAPIKGTARDQDLDYASPPAAGADDDGSSMSAPAADETEALVPLLRRVRAAHPTAAALSCGAILSTYQRTRVEAVAARLGLVPLAYLWQWPRLPFARHLLADDSGGGAAIGAAAGEEAAERAAEMRLLRDLDALGLDARVVRVAGGGLGADLLWARLRERSTRASLGRAARRFGASALGEGGEYETLVVAGPPPLWRAALRVPAEGMSVRRGGAGDAWLEFDDGAEAGPLPGSGAGAEGAESAAEAPERKVSRPELWSERIAAFDQVYDEHGEMWLDQAAPSSAAAQINPSEDQADAWLPPPHVTAAASVTIANLRSAHADAGIEAQTADVCAQLRARLAAHGLAPAALLATTLLLRAMADFGAANAVYGALFARPLPPARVAVACGARLPPGCLIALSATVACGGPAPARRGLHVQSRSYWAPANIGPYSQAIAWAPDAVAELVFVAGQIPLVPATMALLADADDGRDVPEAARAARLFRRQAQLALQHLWAVGAAMRVRWWAHGVAYLTAAHPLPFRRRAELVELLWQHVHAMGPGEAGDSGSTDDDAADDAPGPDLWDRTHGAARHDQRLGATEARPPLPDRPAHAPPDAVPPLFVVEVAELPRAAPVEWHALGVAGDYELPSATVCQVGDRVAVEGAAFAAGEGWADRVRDFVQGNTEEGVRPVVTVYTPFPSHCAAVDALLVPCSRVWSEGQELAAAVVVRREKVAPEHGAHP